ncbi:carbohydrate-binding domain-containing protein [Roseburia sp. MSJ-14]|uniref:carbohydrate-binding domain-containing protein n=1 Tax=Roseburia sp. MSJ-14 TaxID=2841514 RepID=UPI001C110A52|nr:carbohydrate-binding domain-containing protein [Roseburia sp. MSJ-14]MBU5472971.1 carbohydrate-binding domain-containing protein [Roseburia sp. MSJ-14]
MKKEYIKKLGIIFLSVTLVLGVAGCNSSTKESESDTQTEESGEKQGMQQGPGMEQQLTQEELEAYEEADDIEIEALELKTDWNEQAKIILGDTVSIDGTGAEVSDDNTVTITEGGSYVISGELSDGMIEVDTEEEVKLILQGVSITNEDGPAIYVKEAKSCYIETAEGTENILSDGESYAETEDKQKATIFSNDRLVLLGEGSLTVNGNYKHGICSDDEVYVVSGTYTITAVKDGIYTNNWISVEGGKVQITATDDGMQSKGPVALNGGTITIVAEDKGVTAYGDLIVNDGTIQISKCEEGLESKNDLTINGGTTEITGNDDGLNARTSITINGGILYVEMTAGDAIDSNGSMTITGGLILAFGAQMPEGGADCDMNEIKITGGTLIATGGTNSAPSESESSQISVLLGSASKGDMIGILDSDGNTVFAFEAPGNYSNMLLSTATITSGQDYTVYTEGTITGDSYHGYYENGSYTGGTESISFTTDGMVISAGGTSNDMGGFDGGGKMPEDGEKPQMPENGEMPQKQEQGETTESDNTADN